MNKLITLNYDDKFPISGRELHERLKVETRYNDWFARMREYGFADGTDFYSDLSKSTGGRPANDHMLTISMAKEICMLQRTEIGKQLRLYLISVEEQWNQPEAVMARALIMAQQTVESLKASNAELTVHNAIMAPKADYFDALVDRKLNTSFRETAKEFGIKERAFVDFLQEHKYIYRDKKGKLMPYAQYVEDLFVLKECYNDKTEWSGTQTLITPKGRETFRLLIQGMTA